MASRPNKDADVFKVLESFWPKFHTDPKHLRKAGDWVSLQNIYSNLVETGGDKDVRPDLAESWERSRDGLNWTFHLRKDLRWSDGSPMSADQIVASLNAALPGTTHTRFSDFVDSISYSGLDIIFKLKSVPDNFLTLLSYVDLAIVHPRSYDNGQFSWDAPTSGPFRVTIIDSEHMELNVNKFYWDYDPEMLPKIYLQKAKGNIEDLKTLSEPGWDACHIGAGIADEAAVKSLRYIYSVYTSDSDFLSCFFFSPAKVSNGEWLIGERQKILKQLYSEFWKTRLSDNFRATGLRPNGSKGSLSHEQFDKVFNAVSSPSDRISRSINILVQSKHATRPTFIRSVEILKKLGYQVKIDVLEGDAFNKRFDEKKFDLAFGLLGASEGDPDSAWRIYNKDFAEPVASEEELASAQLEHDPAIRDEIYREFERKALKNALFVPIKNEVTYIVINPRISLNTNLSTDWGLRLNRLRMR